MPMGEAKRNPRRANGECPDAKRLEAKNGSFLTTPSIALVVNRRKIAVIQASEGGAGEMGFRNGKDTSLEWRRWLARCRPTLVLCGIPQDAFESQRYWWYFLDHSDLSTGQKPHWFSLAQLSSEQLRRLHAFLEEEYGAQEHPPHLMAVVRNRVRAFLAPLE